MDEIQEQNERAIGEVFIDWYNQQNGTRFVYHGRPWEAPDLTYRDGERQLHFEITQAYYDERDAEFKWRGARGDPNAPTRWSGVNATEKLFSSINGLLSEKCSADYGPGCALIIYVSPPVTLAEDVERELESIIVPSRNSFEGIYLIGDFGKNLLDAASKGGYRCWKLA